MIGTLAMTVLTFLSTECPVSNRSAPEITRLHEEFAPKGVSFRLVYPNPPDDDMAIKKHVVEYGYPPVAERDPNHALVKKPRARPRAPDRHHTRSQKRHYRCTGRQARTPR